MRGTGAQRGVADAVTDVSGNVALTFAVVLSALAGTAALAVDGVSWLKSKSDLQAVADAAALATAREMTKGRVSRSHLQSIAEAYVQAHAAARGARVETSLSHQDRMVSVTVVRQGPVHLAHLLGIKAPTIAARASASNVGETVCVIALDGGPAKLGIYMNENSRLTAHGCSIYSNARGRNGLFGEDRSFMSARLICSAAGYVGQNNFAPRPHTDCPPIADPMVNRPAPPIGACTATNLVVDSNRTLSPGTYCGRLVIERDARVVFSPGVYVFRNGPFRVLGRSELRGQHVAIVLSGDNAQLFFDRGTTIDLSAPKDGPMAGILMFEDRTVPEHLRHNIRSNNAYNLLGTIYFPRGGLWADGDRPIAERSPWTAIVARRIVLGNNAHIVINDRYDETEIPVPLGVGPAGARLQR